MFENELFLFQGPVKRVEQDLGYAEVISKE